MSANSRNQGQQDGDSSLEERLKLEHHPEIKQQIEEEKVDEEVIQVEEAVKQEMKEDEGEGEIEEEAERIDEQSPSNKDEMAEEEVQEMIEQQQQEQGVKRQEIEVVAQSKIEGEQAVDQNDQMEEEVNSNPPEALVNINQQQEQPAEMEEEIEDAVKLPQEGNQNQQINEPENQQNQEGEEEDEEVVAAEGDQEPEEAAEAKKAEEAGAAEQIEQQPVNKREQQSEEVQPPRQQVQQTQQRSSPVKAKPLVQEMVPVQTSPIKQPPNIISKPNLEQIETEKQNEKNRINVELNASNLTYINRLERKLDRQIITNRSKVEQLKTLSDEIKKVRIQLIASKANCMELKKKELELKTQRGKLQREVSNLKDENARQKHKLEQVEKIGDVNQLKNNLEKLQVLYEAQQGQIDELKRNPAPSHCENNFAENLAILSALQAELNKCKEENKHIRQGFSELIEKHRTLNQQQEEYLKKNSLLQQQIQNLVEQNKLFSTQLNNWEKKWQAFEDQRAQTKRARQLEQKVTQYESERHFGDQTQIPIIPTLSLREEKDLLLKEYLILETNYQNKSSELAIANGRLNKLEKEYRNKLSNSIRKKQYNDLMAKYFKAKNCLESAFEKIRTLQKSQQTNRSVSDHVQELLQGNQATLCHNLIRTTTQQLQQMQQRVDGLQMSDALLRSQQENAKNKRKIALLEEEIKSNEKLMHLLNEDNQIKTNLLKRRNTIIDKLKSCHSPPSDIQAQFNKAQQEVKRLKDLVTVYETKCIILIRENQSFNGQFQHWKKLYYSIKDSLSHRIQSSLVEVAPTLLTQERESQQVFTCADCELRKLIEHESAVAKISEGTQTENLSDLHLKEIRELLSALKKVQKIIDQVPKTTDTTMKEMQLFKEKYDRYVERYNTKMDELKKEKEDNDRWRLKTKDEMKDEIREEFQDIRDLITNNRLANALRTAKNLIDYLEKENGQEEQIEEQNDSAEKKE